MDTDKKDYNSFSETKNVAIGYDGTMNNYVVNDVGYKTLCRILKIF